jgi:hypothetical protein
VQTLYKERAERHFTRLWLIGLVGIAYGLVFAFRPALLGQPLVQGSVGVLLGLYICSHPAANAVDLFFFGRLGRYVNYTRRSEAIWLTLNGAVMLIGLAVIIIGATRFSLHSG